jgi:hypothetical protein
MLVCFINTNRYRDIFTFNKCYFFRADHVTRAQFLCCCEATGRVHLKCDGTRWRTGREVKGKVANGVGIQYSSHYLGTWCIQHYYRDAHTSAAGSRLNWRPRRLKWTRLFRRKKKSAVCACAISFQLSSTTCSPSSRAAAVAVLSEASPEHAARRHAQGSWCLAVVHVTTP